jgi:hypothetical protein
MPTLRHVPRHIAALGVALAAALALAGPAPATAGAFEDMIATYESQGAGPFDAARGKAMWTEPHLDKQSGKQRTCASCHTEDLTATGKHAKTGKVIDPLAPSANPDRLTDTAKMKKWFKRNCKWTLGRECTPQEQGDFLSYIRTQ